jgi:ABC-2 type transport system permease protein
MTNGFSHSIYIGLRIAQRDLLDFWKAKMLFATFMLMPLLMMSMFGFMFPTTTGTSTPYKNAPLAIVVEDDGSLAIQVADQFKEIASSSSLFKVQDFPNYESARGEILTGRMKGVVVIPEGFAAALNSHRQASVVITVDDTNPTMSSIIYAEAASIVKIISDGMGQVIISKMGYPGDPSVVQELISVQRLGLIGSVSATSSFEFLAPGFMALTVVMGGLSGLASAIAREREQGTMDGIMVAPISRDAIVAGKMAAQTVRGMIQGFMILGLSMLLFGVRVYGSPLLMVIVMLLGVASFSGIGIIATSIAPEQETAMMMMMLLQFPMMFLSGVLFPIDQFPGWLQWVGKALPLYYAADALRKVIVLSATFNQILPDILILVAYSLVTLTIAIPIFRKAMTR